jgi:hypothetical protein
MATCASSPRKAYLEQKVFYRTQLKKSCDGQHTCLWVPMLLVAVTLWKTFLTCIAAVTGGY